MTEENNKQVGNYKKKSLDFFKNDFKIRLKPEEIDKIYKKTIKNEHSKALSLKNRKKYIHSLVEQRESFMKVAKTIGMSESWARKCAIAYNVQKKYQSLFNNTNINFSTKNIYAFRNATEEQVMDAVALICKNPDKKYNILEDLNKKTKKKMNVGGKRKNKENSLSGSINIAFSINLDEENKTFSIQTKKDESIDDILENMLLEEFKKYYAQKGYASL
jgi:hypothetical protein